MNNQPVYFTLEILEHSYLDTFHLRQEEEFIIYSSPLKNGYPLLVMLAGTPQLPGEQHPEVHQLTVLACAQYHTHETIHNKPKYGWIHLGTTTKEVIGKALLDRSDTELNRWYYLYTKNGLGSENGHPD